MTKNVDKRPHFVRTPESSNLKTIGVKEHNNSWWLKRLVIFPQFWVNRAKDGLRNLEIYEDQSFKKTEDLGRRNFTLRVYCYSNILN